MKHTKEATRPRWVGRVLLALPCLVVVGCDAHHGEREHGADQADHEDHEGHDDHGDEPVRLTAEQIASAGIRTEPATAGAVERRLTLPAVIEADADAVTHVNPKAPGIVRSVHKALGEFAEADELLATIDSVQLGDAVADFVRARALVDAAETTLARSRALFQDRLTTAEQVLDGAIEVDRKIHAREVELQERSVSTVRPLLEAERALRVAELDKVRELSDLRAERDARILELEIELEERRIRADSARNALLALGIAPAELGQLGPEAPLLAGRYELRAARAGVVSGRHITVGEYVDSQTKLYTLEDLSRVWVLASAAEDQVRSIETGQVGRVRLDAFPDQAFEGQVERLGYHVDSESRSLGIRLELANEKLLDWGESFPLRPGMFGRVDLVVARVAARVALHEDSLVHEPDGEFVFVRVAPDTFERRRIRAGATSPSTVEVTEGVEPGEEVVVEGTFHLKSAFRAGELGGGHSH